MVLPPQAQNPLVVRRHLLHEASVGPDATLAPERVLRFELLDARQQTPITLGHLKREVAIHAVRLACERPDTLGRSLSQWDCTELAHPLIAEGVVEDISAATVRRILAGHQLKPWRHHLRLHPKQPRDAAFYARILERFAIEFMAIGA